jgi:hypothetical protein
MARADRETWAKRVERWRESGLSAAEFAAEIGVTPKSLSWWKWQLGKASAAPATKRRRKTAKVAVSPLTFVEMSSPVRSEPIEIVFPSGVRVRVPVSADAAALTRVIQALGTPR